MATVTPILDKRYKAKDNLFHIKVRIIKGNIQEYIPTKCRVSENQWKNGKVVKHIDAALYNEKIHDIISKANNFIASQQLKKRDVNIKLIRQGNTSFSFIDYLKHRAAQYNAKGQIVMDRKLRRFAKELQQCFNRDVVFDDINTDLLRDFEAYLVSQGNCNNTRNKKFKFLREYYDHAIDEQKASAPNPFKIYKIPTDPVKKDKLTAEEMERIEQADLAPGPVNDVRNLFLFSYYTKGSRFETCVIFRREQINNGRLMIHMNKGKKFISVKLHKRLQSIIDQYAAGNSFVFPYIKDLPEDPKAYLELIASKNTIVNRDLKVLAGICGIKTRLTFHIARHTLAQRLKEKSADIHSIKEALGHSDTRITERYLASLGDERLDKEMEKVYGL